MGVLHQKRCDTDLLTAHRQLPASPAGVPTTSIVRLLMAPSLCSRQMRLGRRMKNSGGQGIGGGAYFGLCPAGCSSCISATGPCCSTACQAACCVACHWDTGVWVHSGHMPSNCIRAQRSPLTSIVVHPHAPASGGNGVHGIGAQTKTCNNRPCQTIHGCRPGWQQNGSTRARTQAGSSTTRHMIMGMTQLLKVGERRSGAPSRRPAGRISSGA